MNLQPGEPIEIKISDRASMDSALNAAVDRMIEVALRQGTQGILVTRLGDGRFIVCLSDAVPFGLTELDSRYQAA